MGHATPNPRPRRLPARRRRPRRPVATPIATPLSPLELALRERVKELACLYAISKLRDQHLDAPDQFLQGVVDCLPGSWQFPEHASARLTHGPQRFATAGFRDGPWRMAAEIRVDGQVTGQVEVVYAANVPAPDGTPFLPEEQALIHAVAARVGTVLTLMKAEHGLRDAHQALQRQHQTLQETHAALRVVLSRLEEEKREIRASMLANLQRVIMPIVFELELEASGRQRAYVSLLRQSLQDIASPFLTQVARQHLELTPVELAVGTMIANGLATKEIADLRRISPATVRRHRENIRRKLGLCNRKVNLVTYLQAAGADPVAAAPLPVAPGATPSAR